MKTDGAMETKPQEEKHGGLLRKEMSVYENESDQL